MPGPAWSSLSRCVLWDPHSSLRCPQRGVTELLYDMFPLPGAWYPHSSWRLPGLYHSGDPPAPSYLPQALTPSSYTRVAVIAFGNKGLGNRLPTWGKPHCCHSNRGRGSSAAARQCKFGKGWWGGQMGGGGDGWGRWSVSGSSHVSILRAGEIVALASSEGVWIGDGNFGQSGQGFCT